VRDRATYDNPHQYSEGFIYVFVNGVPVVEKGKRTEQRPGQVLRANNTLSTSERQSQTGGQQK